MAQLHEVLTTLNDLQERGELEIAEHFAREYISAQERSEVDFILLALLARAGKTDRLIEQLETGLQTGRWFSAWFLRRDSRLNEMLSLPRFQHVLAAIEEQEKRYWHSRVMEPILQGPPVADPPYPLLIALHGNGFNAQHSADHWAPALDLGWMVFHPLAKRLVGYEAHWWAQHEENIGIITEQAEPVLKRPDVDRERVILGGFSKGGETAIVLSAAGTFGAKGFVAVGAGGYLHLDPDQWQPWLQAAPPDLRGVTMYDTYDFQRAGGVAQTLESLRAAGITVQVEMYEAEGHVFPPDFRERFQRAAAFVLREETDR